MTPYKKNVQGYQQIQVGSATPEKLLLMVYDGALKYMKSAKLQSEKNNPAKAQASLLRASDFIVELLATLNHEASPEIAGTLHSLYVYIIDRIKSFLQTNNYRDLDEAINILTGLKVTWEEAFTTQEAAAMKKVG